MVAKKETYDQAFSRLENIIRQIEGEEIPIDRLEKKIQEANEIIAYCSAKLKKAGADVEKILKEK